MFQPILDYYLDGEVFDQFYRCQIWRKWQTSVIFFRMANFCYNVEDDLKGVKFLLMIAMPIVIANCGKFAVFYTQIWQKPGKFSLYRYACAISITAKIENFAARASGGGILI